MTDHKLLKMRKSDRQVKDCMIIQEMLDMCPVCTLAIHDEPYPYEVPMNFGYTWGKELVIYLHMASEGHKVSLLKKNPYVTCNMYVFVDRSNCEKYRGEHQDYRSVTVFGKAEIITANQPEVFLNGLNQIQKHYKRKPISKAPATDQLLVVMLKADMVTAKAMYPINKVTEVAMPENK